MAIQFNYTDEFGNNNPEAYARVRFFTVDQPDDEYISGSLPNPVLVEARLSCKVFIYKDHQAFLDRKAPHVKHYSVDTDTATAAAATIMTAYNYIKSLPEYAGAIDVP